MATANTLVSTHGLLPEFDYDYSIVAYKFTGSPVVQQYMKAGAAADGITTATGTSLPIAGTLGSGCFAMAIDLETSNGMEISGLNAEEQSDISLIARYSSTQSAGFVFDVFTYIDSMIVLKENNVKYLLT